MFITFSYFQIMDKLLDKEMHQQYKAPSMINYLSGHKLPTASVHGGLGASSNSSHRRDGGAGGGGASGSGASGHRSQGLEKSLGADRVASGANVAGMSSHYCAILILYQVPRFTHMTKVGKVLLNVVGRSTYEIDTLLNLTNFHF